MDLKFIRIVILLWVWIDNSIGETQLECQFDTFSYTLWPSSKICKISNANLENKNQNFQFIGSNSEIQQTQNIHFRECPNSVEYLPVEMFETFPSLNGLLISQCNIPDLKTDLFSDTRFKKIQYLDLPDNKITKIEKGAFDQMTNLKWISFGSNRLTTLESDTFKNNLQIEYIDFDVNDIKFISSSLFENLRYLKYIRFNYNACYNYEIGCESCSSLETQEINEKLEDCYENYQNIYGEKNSDDDSKAEIDELKKDLEKTNEEKQQLETKYNTDIESRDEEISQLKKELEKTKEEASEANDEIEEYKKKIQDQELEIQGKNEKISQMEKELQNQNRDANQELINQISNLEKENKKLKEDLENCKSQNDISTNNNNDVNKIKSELEAKIKEMNQENQQQTESLKKDLERQYDNGKINNLEGSLENQSKKTTKIEDEIKRLEVQMISLFKVFLVGINFDETEAKEIKGDIDKIEKGAANMKTYQKAIDGNFAERENGLEEKFNQFLTDIVDFDNQI